MSTYFTDIAAAFRNRLISLPSAPPIAHENDRYQPSGILYLSYFILPAETLQATLGDTGKDITEGIFQVNTHIPHGQGHSTWPDAIADHFKRGTILTRNSVNLRIQAVSIAQGVRVGNYFNVPVDIRWQTFTEARA